MLITGCEYGPGDEVALRLTRRDRRVTVSDEGAAVARAGQPRGSRPVADRLERELEWAPKLPPAGYRPRSRAS
jgi:hypothetical protein